MGGGGNDARVNQNVIDSDAQFTDKKTDPLDANSAIIGNTESLFEGSNIMWRRKQFTHEPYVFVMCACFMSPVLSKNHAKKSTNQSEYSFDNLAK